MESGRISGWMQSVRHFRRYFPLVAAVCAVLPFLPSLGYGFLYEWDDGGFVTENAHIALNWPNLVHAFTTTLQSVYTPLTSVWLMADHALFGDWAGGYHLVNLLLYGGCGALLFLIMRRLRIPASAALLLAVLWAWNPGKCESVAWIAERKGLASSFFAFASFWCFMRDCRRERAGWAAPVLMLIAFLFKPWVLPLPGVMCLYAWSRHPGEYRKLLKLLWPVMAAGCAGALLVMGMTFRDLSVSGGGGAPDFRYVLRYFGAAVWPLSLNPIHPRPVWGSLLPELAWGAVLAAGLWCAAGRSRERLRVSLLFTLAFLGTALPVLTSGGFTNADYCDRYNFLLSAVAWCWIGVAGGRYFRRFPRVSAWAAGILLAGCLLTDLVYLETFSDTRLLFGRAAAADRPAPKALEGLALVAVNRSDPGLLHQAGALFLAQQPFQPESRRKTYSDMGTLLTRLARTMAGEAAAGRELAAYLAADVPRDYYTPEAFLPPAYSLAAGRLIQDGNAAEAAALLELQLKRKAGDAYQLHFSSGLAGFLTKDFERARREWRAALELRPGDARLRENLKRAEAMP